MIVLVIIIYTNDLMFSQLKIGTTCICNCPNINYRQNFHNVIYNKSFESIDYSFFMSCIYNF